MQSVIKIYAQTSKGNAPLLHKELLNLGLNVKYDDILHCFYFYCSWTNLFKLSFSSFALESLYAQIGSKFYVQS